MINFNSYFSTHNSEQEKELEKQSSEIKRILAIVFTPIIIMLFIKAYCQSNSLEYNKKRYVEVLNTNFKGTVIQKRQEGDYPRAGRFVLLDNYYEERIDTYIYQQIEIGDFVIKSKGRDSIYFHLKNGKIIAQDYTGYEKECYKKLLNKK